MDAVAVSIRRNSRWVVLAAVAITTVAAIGAWLTAPRLGGRMDPEATSPSGGHALVSLLRERGVEVVVARTVEDVELAARPDSLVLITETHQTRGENLLGRLATVSGDRLVVEPTPLAREVLAPGIRLARGGRPGGEPECDLRAAERAGVVQIAAADSYTRAGETPVTRCYGGALVRYQADGRTVTVLGSADFMTNGSLLKEGNAALAMNLAGERPRLIWYAPNTPQGDPAGGATIGELVPRATGWVVLQLCVAVVLAALWRGRRFGPLVPERLPVVVRASETVEGRARLYRSRRARDRAADALRTATLQRLRPRIGLAGNATDAAVVAAVAQYCGGDLETLRQTLFGPAPETDTDLTRLAAALDAIERQVNQL